MKYYILKATAQEKISGVFPQVDSYSLNIKGILENIGRNKFPADNPYLDHLILNDEAKLTNLLSVVYFGSTDIYVDNKLNDIICKHNVHEYIKLNSKLLSQGKLHDYYLLHLTNKNLDGLDFENSQFSIISISGKNIKDLGSLSMKQFYEERSRNIEAFAITGKLDIVSAVKIKLTSSFIERKIDLFTFSIACPKIFVSEDLRIIIEKNNISGIRFLEQAIIQL